MEGQRDIEQVSLQGWRRQPEAFEPSEEGASFLGHLQVTVKGRVLEDVVVDGHYLLWQS